MDRGWIFNLPFTCEGLGVQDKKAIITGDKAQLRGGSASWGSLAGLEGMSPELAREELTYWPLNDRRPPQTGESPRFPFTNQLLNTRRLTDYESSVLLLTAVAKACPLSGPFSFNISILFGICRD